MSRRRPLEPDAAPAAMARRMIGNQLDAERIEGRDEFHQRIDIAPDHAIACFHPLDGRQRKPGRLRQLALVYPENGARGPELPGSDHCGLSNIIDRIDIFVYMTLIVMFQALLCTF